MTATRTIATLVTSPMQHWVGDGFLVSNYFPGQLPFASVSPFLLLDYQKPHHYPATTNPRRGVGPHPHRGFETVTLALEGAVAHHDSVGNGGIIYPGDVQWMTAGAGILHREYHEKNFAKQGGNLHMVQLWVNLPKAHKMTAPRYQHLQAATMGQVALPNAGGTVRVIAGSYQGAQGPAMTFSPVTLLDISLHAGGQVPLEFAEQDNVSVLVLGGEVTFDAAQRSSHGDLAVFGHTGTQITVAAKGEARILVMAGTPIREPIAHHGPFVMNTRQEVVQAMNDFEHGKFGYLED